MLLTIATTHQPATDLGYLLHKHPDRCQTFNLTFGKAHVFYPEANPEHCVACLLLDVDPVGLVRGKGNWKDGLLDQYVNDRPYVASSLMSVAISQVFGSALSGKSKERVELVDKEIPLTARIDVLPVRGGPNTSATEMLERMFGPLGYAVTATRHPLDDKFPEWGESPYYSVELTQSTTVAKLLQHLYVLIPVFDGKKHYYIGPDEVEKLLSKGESWLADHPEKATITRRYLSKRQSLIRQALARLVGEEAIESEDEEATAEIGNCKMQIESVVNRNTTRVANRQFIICNSYFAICNLHHRSTSSSATFHVVRRRVRCGMPCLLDANLRRPSLDSHIALCPYGEGRIENEDMPHNQFIEEPPQCREMQFARRDCDSKRIEIPADLSRSHLHEVDLLGRTPR